VIYINGGDGPKPFISKRTFDLIKYFIWIVLPTAGTVYFVLALVWGLPAEKEVLGSIVVIQTAVNVVLGINANSFAVTSTKPSGTIEITESLDKTTYSLELDEGPEMLDDMEEIVFRVKKMNGDK
jgi:hypothetical protein